MLAALVWVTGCETTPPPDPNVERGPHGTIAYNVLIEATPPGAKIEANGQIVGDAPLRLKIFGDKDGTFHDFGSEFYVIRALPIATNQYPQVAMFGTGRRFGPEDRIPQQLSFDMNRPSPQYLPPPGYPYPYPAPYYYYYPPPYYYGPPAYYYHHSHEGIHVHRR